MRRVCIFKSIFGGQTRLILSKLLVSALSLLYSSGRPAVDVICGPAYPTCYSTFSHEVAQSNWNMDQLPNLLHELSSESDLPSAISRLLKSAALLINCDRATLFLVDRTEAPGFLYIGLSKGLLRVSSAAHHRRLAAVRIPIDRSSIAGFVAATGEAALIKDAYSDPRFDRRVDVSTGYRTTSVLCVPLKDAHGKVVAVLQAVNKLPLSAAFGHGSVAAEPSPAVHAPPSTAASAAASIPEHAAAAAAGGGPDVDAPAFTEEDKALLGAVADVAGSILHQLTLQAVAARERARGEQMIALVRQISAASTTTRLGDVVDAVIDGTYRLLAVQRVTLYLLDDTRRHLVIASSQVSALLSLACRQLITSSSSSSGTTP